MPQIEEVHCFGQVIHLDLPVVIVGQQDLPGSGYVDAAEFDSVAENHFYFFNRYSIFRL